MTRQILILITTICFYLSHFTTDGRKAKSNDVIKSIKTEDGVYDCVDFYKQPSLKHPLLQNHSFHPEMRPTFIPAREIEKSDESTIDIELKRVNCPKDTVPMRRLGKEDKRLQTQIRRKQYAHLGKARLNDNEQSNTYFAIAQSANGPRTAFNGIASVLSIFNPHVEQSQYSSGEIIIKGGMDAIIVGWTVNPMIYKDNQTRMFLYAVAGGEHCFNAQCGFVHLSHDITLDTIFVPVSTLKRDICTITFWIYRENGNGNWWLLVQNTVVGYWPQNIFKGLYERNSGDYIACGGEAYGPSYENLPYMGSGFQPDDRDTNKWPYCYRTMVLDEAMKWVFYDDFEPYLTLESDYNVYYQKSNRLVNYGGPIPSLIHSK